MGTNGLVGFRHHGVRKGAYNHNDSDVYDLGQRIVNFIMALSNDDIQLMLDRVSALTWVTEDSPPPQDLQERYMAAGVFSGGVSTGKPSEWYCLLRGAQDARCLRLIKDGVLEHMLDATSILDDPWCWAAYFIDFEEKVLEVVCTGNGDEKIVREFTFQELDSGSMLRLNEEKWRQ